MDRLRLDNSEERIDPANSRGLKDLGASSPGKGGESFKEGGAFLTPYLLLQPQ